MPERVWRIFYHSHLRQLAALWQAGKLFEFDFRLIPRRIFNKELVGDPEGPYTIRYSVSCVRREQHPLDIMQAALAAHYKLNKTGDPWFSMSPYSIARELGICRAVTDAVLLAASQSGQYDRRVREVILQSCGLSQGE